MWLISYSRRKGMVHLLIQILLQSMFICASIFCNNYDTCIWVGLEDNPGLQKNLDLG